MGTTGVPRGLPTLWGSTLGVLPSVGSAGSNRQEIHTSFHGDGDIFSSIYFVSRYCFLYLSQVIGLSLYLR